MKIGDNIIILENTPDFGILEHEGEIVAINEAFVETKHYRSPTKYPQFKEYLRAYCDTWTKHYYHPDGKLPLIKPI